MGSWASFWHMGGYAPYVWGAYAVALLVLAGNVLAPVVRHRRIKRELRTRMSREPRSP